MFIFFFKQKTAYEIRISDWSSDVCSSDLMESNEPRPGSGIRKPQLDVDPAMPADPNNVVCFGGQVRGMTTWSWKTRRASIASNHLVRCGRTPLSSRHSANHRQAK